MSTQVTEQDLRNFASLGFPASVSANDNADAEGLAESVLHVLESPSARLASVAAMALQSLAATNDIDRLCKLELTDDVRRRLGYLSERLSQDEAAPQKVARRLARLARRLHRDDDDAKAPLTLLAASNPTLLRLYAERADNVQKKWTVFGDLDLPTYAAYSMSDRAKSQIEFSFEAIFEEPINLA